MSKFVKTAIAAAMVMGVFTSTATSLRVTTVLHVFTAPLKTQCVLSFRTITNWKLIWVISVPKN
ncbi:fimbrial-like adhesin protein [Escherichia coli]|uniref:Fimbrial-like adhesin protein n=1 Tax=Escherichia coli TaxID=562 RepID=A0A2X3LU22_ECOLX|nr:fimbrial-like adhesin protein [Escherichia coli]